MAVRKRNILLFKQADFADVSHWEPLTSHFSTMLSPFGGDLMLISYGPYGPQGCQHSRYRVLRERVTSVRTLLQRSLRASNFLGLAHLSCNPQGLSKWVCRQNGCWRNSLEAVPGCLQPPLDSLCFFFFYESQPSKPM